MNKTTVILTVILAPRCNTLEAKLARTFLLHKPQTTHEQVCVATGTVPRSGNSLQQDRCRLIEVGNLDSQVLHRKCAVVSREAPANRQKGNKHTSTHTHTHTHTHHTHTNGITHGVWNEALLLQGGNAVRNLHLNRCRWHVHAVGNGLSIPAARTLAVRPQA